MLLFKKLFKKIKSFPQGLKMYSGTQSKTEPITEKNTVLGVMWEAAAVAKQVRRPTAWETAVVQAKLRPP